MADPIPQRTAPSVLGEVADGDNAVFAMDPSGAVNLKKGSGGGGGAAIQPETGSSPIKISAFPNAAGTGMGSADSVTGLQGGANVNWTQAQLLRTPDAAPSSGLYGNNLIIAPGAGDGAGGGGNLYLSGAYNLSGGGTTGKGGNVNIEGGGGGATSGNGGHVNIFGGVANSIGVGGYLHLYGGNSVGGGGNGGAVVIYGGNSAGAATKSGNVTIGPGNPSAGAADGVLYFRRVTVAASSAGLVSGTVWINSSTRVLSVAP